MQVNRRDDEAAAATGPGTETTDHHRTDGGSLTTPVSSPEVDQKAKLDLVKPLPPPPSVKSTTPPKQTQPRTNESRENGRAVVDRDDNDEGCRAHKRVDNPAHGADTSTDETTAIATASVSTDAAAPHYAPNTPLKGEQSGRELTGEVGARTEVGEGEDGGEKCLPDKSSKPTEPTSPPDEVMATRDQDQELSAPRDHLDNVDMRNPTRPSEDPGDVTGDDEHCPDAPTELPNKPEGTGWHGDEQSVKGVQLRGLRVSRVSMEGHREPRQWRRRSVSTSEARRPRQRS